MTLTAATHALRVLCDALLHEKAQWRIQQHSNAYTICVWTFSVEFYCFISPSYMNNGTRGFFFIIFLHLAKWFFLFSVSHLWCVVGFCWYQMRHNRCAHVCRNLLCQIRIVQCECQHFLSFSFFKAFTTSESRIINRKAPNMRKRKKNEFQKKPPNNSTIIFVAVFRRLDMNISHFCECFFSFTF